jgi:molecular chaperone GrpE
MILRQLDGLLKDFGVRRIETVGEPFDPEVHDAVSRQEDPDVERPTVSEELQAGYVMHDRLLRPATVAVAMPGRPDEEPEG